MTSFPRKTAGSTAESRTRPVAIDLRLGGLPGAISTYLVGGGEPTLVDPGPVTTLANLEAGLIQVGCQPSDVQRICLTHIHLDHAGCVGEWVRRHPHVEVFVHGDGAGHMAEPERLVKSTRRTFGDAHDRLWGEVLPVPRENLNAWTEGSAHPAALEVVPAPGHIQHHLAYVHSHSGTLLAGDSLGIILAPGAPTHPATPPPSVQVDAWFATLDRLADLGVGAVGVAHFGIHEDPLGRIGQMREALMVLVERVRNALRAGDFSDRDRFQRDTVELQSGIRDQAQVAEYFAAFGAGSDWDGVRFWLERNDTEFSRNS